MHSDYSSPLNLGTDRLVSINELAAMITHIAGNALRSYTSTAPRVFADVTRTTQGFRRVLAWEPSTPLEGGLEATYAWIADQVESVGQNAGPPPHSILGRQGDPSF